MDTKAIAKNIIRHFQSADRYNQLRPGETHLAIMSFFEGFTACMSIVDSIKLTSAEFEEVQKELDEYFDQFDDEPVRG